MSDVIDLRQEPCLYEDLWHPRVVAELNDVQFKVVKFEGDFVWHKHDDTDEAFLVIQGEMIVEFRDRVVRIREGQLFVVPKGDEHITAPRRSATR